MFETFRTDVPPEAIDDLRRRLKATPWPRTLGDDWSRGVPVEYLRGVVEQWSEFDWRVWEARLNAIPQYTTEIDGQTIHFLHARSAEPAAVPLLLTHGWPGSVAEFLEVIGPLTNPARYGGDAADAFHIIAPSVPGHGFSVPLDGSGWDHLRIARAWIELMERLGYPWYGAQGGDQAANRLVRPQRFTGRTARLDPGEVPRLDRPCSNASTT